MIRAVVKVCRKVNHRITRKNTLLHAFLKTCFYCREEVFRYGTAKYTLGKGQAFGFTGCKLNFYVSVLTRAAGLLLMLSFYLNGLLDGLSVSELGLREIYGSTEAAPAVPRESAELFL